MTVENTLTGCIITDEVEILQDANIPVVNVGTANPLTCDSISVTLFASTDLTTPVEYTWTGPGITNLNENDQNPLVSVEGDYFVTIFNPANSCTSSPGLVTVEDNSQSPAIDFVIPLEMLDCDTDGILVDASGSQGNLSFEWTNSVNEIISTASAFEITVPDSYQLLVTNTETGCTATESFIIEQDLTVPIPMIATPGMIDCNNPSIISVSYTHLTLPTKA